MCEKCQHHPQLLPHCRAQFHAFACKPAAETHATSFESVPVCPGSQLVRRLLMMRLHEQNKSEMLSFRKKSVPMPTCSNSCEIQRDVGLLPHVVFSDIKNHFAMKQVLCLKATESIQLQLSGKSQLSDKQLGAATMRQSACRQHGCYRKGKQASPIYLEPCFLCSKLGEHCVDNVTTVNDCRDGSPVACGCFQMVFLWTSTSVKCCACV